MNWLRMGMVGVLGAGLAATAHAEAVCTPEAMCKVGVAPKGAKALVAAGEAGAAGLWALGPKGQAWLRGPTGFGKPVKTGAKQDLLAGATLGSGLIAVGKAGTVVRWDGNLWTVDKPAVKKDLLAVWVAGGHAWAVGKAGTIVAWDGSSWKPEASGIKTDLRGIWGSREGDLWAVGDKGTILHSDGTGWTTARTGNAQLNAVTGTSARNAFAIGQLGAMLHWDGRAWSSLKVGVASDLLTALTIGDTDLVCLGDAGSGVRYWRDDWSAMTAGESNFISAAVVQKTGQLLTADGAIWEYNGGWSNLPSPTGESGIEVVAAKGEVVVAAGDDGMAAKRVKGVWQKLYDQPPTGVGTILGATFDGKDILTVDYDGHIMRIPDGKPPVLVTQLHNKESVGYNAIYMASKTVGFVVGSNGMIFRWDGKAWTQIASPVKDTLNTLFGLGPDAIWAAGEEGAIAFWNGKTWTKQANPSDETLEAIWATSPSSAMAVGHSAVLTWDGASWIKLDPPVGGLIRSVCGVSVDQVFMGTNNGQIVYWDGKRWIVEASPTGAALKTCVVTAAGEVVFGDQNNGVITHAPFPPNK